MAIDFNILKCRNTSLFDLTEYVKCVKSSINVSTYLLPSYDSGFTGPNKSLCINCRGFVFGRFFTCGSFVCLPCTQFLQMYITSSFDFSSMQSTILFNFHNPVRLMCPKRLCHRSVPSSTLQTLAFPISAKQISS